jgi:hypothetical protein
MVTRPVTYVMSQGRLEPSRAQRWGIAGSSTSDADMLNPLALLGDVGFGFSVSCMSEVSTVRLRFQGPSRRFSHSSSGGGVAPGIHACPKQGRQSCNHACQDPGCRRGFPQSIQWHGFADFCGRPRKKQNLLLRCVLTRSATKGCSLHPPVTTRFRLPHDGILRGIF